MFNMQVAWLASVLAVGVDILGSKSHMRTDMLLQVPTSSLLRSEDLLNETTTRAKEVWNMFTQDPGRAHVDNIASSSDNVFFMWYGNYPDQSHWDQIRRAVSTVKISNPSRTIYLFSDVIAGGVDAYTVNISFHDLVALLPADIPRPNLEQDVEIKFKTDIARLVVLWKWGGSYIDSDDISVRPLGDHMNSMAANFIEQGDPPGLGEVGGTFVIGEFAHACLEKKWRFGNDPLLNMKPGNLFIEEWLRQSAAHNFKDWGQHLPTTIFESNPEKWRDYVSPTPWPDMLYHPKYGGHAPCDVRYPGEKIGIYDQDEGENMCTIVHFYKFPLVKNHMFAETGDKHTILADLLKFGQSADDLVESCTSRFRSPTSSARK